MSQSSQAVETRLRTGGDAESLGIPKGPVGSLRHQEDAPNAECRTEARLAHRPLTFVVPALVVLAVAGVLTSALTYRAGLAWRDWQETDVIRTQGLAARLSNAEAQVARSTRDLSKANAQLAATASQLQRSEADVAQLEGRLQALGTEKAKVEDEREAVRDDRDRLAEIAGLATRVGQDVDTCVNGLSAWLASRPSPQDATQPALSAWAGSGDSVAAICTDAQVSNDKLKTAISG
ncbi:MAG: hypothetical protein ACRDYA_03990 [Egibacteraceae bacterium]